MFQPGSRNLITDVSGIRVGHGTDEGVRSGVTVLTWDAAWPAAVDVRGGGPGTRETDVLAPENLVGRAHALVLSGGSVFGLAAADGVTATLSAQGIGLALSPGSPTIPIVPAAVLHDLANGGNKAWGTDPPYRTLGMHALQSATDQFALGSIGAGRGAMAGVLKGGIGSASLALDDEIIGRRAGGGEPDRLGADAGRQNVLGLGSRVERRVWRRNASDAEERGSGNPAPEHTRLHAPANSKPAPIPRSASSPPMPP